MMGDTEDETNRLVSKFLGNMPSRELVNQLKSTKRDEVLTRLASLLDTAFKNGVKRTSKTQVQQRWFTICAYVAQVMARLVRDLEYEKLRADVDDLKRRVLEQDVSTPRRTRYTLRYGKGRPTAD